jgi:hypothetical protein
MKTWLRIVFLAACLLSLGAVTALSGPVTLSLRDGLVTLRAQDATPRQILTEWARVGRVTIVNLERMPGSPMTVELVDMPESKALDIVLRAIGGFVAAPRAVRESQASQFDRIFVMTTLAPANPAVAGATTLPRPMGGPQSLRTMPDQMQNRRGMGGMGGPPDAGDLNDERNEDADEPRANRPPLGMRPGESVPPPTDPGAGAPASPMVRPGVMTTPGATMPPTAAKPGQAVPTPQKPPGDLR